MGQRFAKRVRLRGLVYNSFIKGYRNTRGFCKQTELRRITKRIF